MVTWRDRVALSCSARDQHTPGVFLPALARAGYGLFFRLRKVPIWTSEGRPLMGGSRRRRVLCTHWFFRLFVSCACIPELLLVLVVNSSLVSQSTGFQ